MHLLFIKCNLIIFEIISLLLLIAIFFALFYYSIIYKNLSAMKDENNIENKEIIFSANFSKGVFADIDIKLYHNETNETSIPGNHRRAYILYCKTYFDIFNNDEERIINEISKDNPYNIFLFENKKLAENFKHYLLNLRTETSTFNLTLFALISLYLIFLKITLLKDSIVRLKKIKSSKSDGKNEIYINLLAQIHPEEFALAGGKEEPKKLYYNPVLSFLNPINVYYYILFHLTIVIIIPLIFPNYIEYNVASYFKFIPNMYNSVYYGRALYGTDRLTESDVVDLSKLVVIENATEQKKYFILHNYLDLSGDVSTNTNPYMINLLILCGSIWLSQLFNPFNSESSVKIVDVDLKKGKLKRIMKIASIIAVFCIWGFFIIYGIIYLLDIYALFHRLLFYNIRRFLDPKIPLFLGLFYYHIAFYVIMGIYTYQTYKKNKNYEGSQIIHYNWFS